jgi:hypothetical protein
MLCDDMCFGGKDADDDGELGCNMLNLAQAKPGMCELSAKKRDMSQ